MKPGGMIAIGFTAHSGQTNEGLTETLSAAGFSESRVMRLDEGICILATIS
jgi:hypothetical protein